MRVIQNYISNSCVFVILFLILIYIKETKNAEQNRKLMRFKVKLRELEELCRSSTADSDQVLDVLFQDALEKFNSEFPTEFLIIDNIIEHLRNKLRANKMMNSGPSQIYENLRRRIQVNLGNFLDVVGSAVQPRVNEVSLVSELKSQIFNQTEAIRITLLNNIDKLADFDDHNKWRWKSSKAASDLVQHRLQYLQNPANCSFAKKLVCALNMDCGFGCQFHHIMYCLVMAYATERTLILDSNSWRVQTKSKIWEDIFKPITPCHLESSEISTIVDWNQLGLNHNQDHKVIKITKLGLIKPRPPYLPLAVPIDLKPSLDKFHGNPSVWWIGQITKFLWKPAESTQSMLLKTSMEIGFKTPIVGVHIRRTDKILEAKYYKLHEYMTHVDEYFQKLEKTEGITQRRIFLASDEPKIFHEMKEIYPQYEVIQNKAALRPVDLDNRYLNGSLDGIILDTHLLSLCDYLVCTLSSNVCRLAFELMQSRYVDASNKFKSLDNDYHYPGQHSQYRMAVIAHSPRGDDEVPMEVGDVMDVSTQRMMPTDLDEGKNERTQKTGKFPSFKTVSKIRWEIFPIYPQVQ